MAWSAEQSSGAAFRRATILEEAMSTLINESVFAADLAHYIKQAICDIDAMNKMIVNLKSDIEEVQSQVSAFSAGLSKLCVTYNWLESTRRADAVAEATGVPADVILGDMDSLRRG
jgi:hypothetical protein